MPCAKGMTACRRGCLHRQMVKEYRDARAAAEAARERATLGYATEEREHGPILDFRVWLIGRRRGQERAA